jgi:hypothetical protein
MQDLSYDSRAFEPVYDIKFDILRERQILLLFLGCLLYLRTNMVACFYPLGNFCSMLQ